MSLPLYPPSLHTHLSLHHHNSHPSRLHSPHLIFSPITILLKHPPALKCLEYCVFSLYHTYCCWCISSTFRSWLILLWVETSYHRCLSLKSQHSNHPYNKTITLTIVTPTTMLILTAFSMFTLAIAKPLQKWFQIQCSALALQLIPCPTICSHAQCSDSGNETTSWLHKLPATWLTSQE